MTPAWLREVFEQDDRNQAEVARWEAKRPKKSEPEVRSKDLPATWRARNAA
jgi:hypothetical protein